MNNGIFEKQYIVEFTHCYANARLKFSDLSNFLQLTAGEHASACGIGFHDMAKNHQAWVLSRIRIEIQKLPKWLDKITVRTWVEEIEDARSTRNFEVLVNDRIYVSASTYWAVINTIKRTSEKLAIDTNNFEIFPHKKATEKPFGKLNLAIPTKLFEEYTVKLSDLDIINHVNNVKYLDWCMDRLPIELVMENQIKSLEMNYLRELRYNDDVEINGTSIESGYFMTVSRKDKINYALQIETK